MLGISEENAIAFKENGHGKGRQDGNTQFSQKEEKAQTTPKNMRKPFEIQTVQIVGAKGSDNPAGAVPGSTLWVGEIGEAVVLPGEPKGPNSVGQAIAQEVPILEILI